MLIMPTSSRASSAPTVSCVTTDLGPTQNHCGSELAHECGVSGTGDVDHADVFASNLGSHRTCVLPQIRASTQNHCGSELARECGGSVTHDVSGLTPSRASPLQQFAGTEEFGGLLASPALVTGRTV